MGEAARYGARMPDASDDRSSPSPVEQRLRDVEELYMHLERLVRDLDQVVVEQGRHLAALDHKLRGLGELVQGISAAQSGPPGNPLDEKPPHY